LLNASQSQQNDQMTLQDENGVLQTSLNNTCGCLLGCSGTTENLQASGSNHIIENSDSSSTAAYLSPFSAE
jgi:hypothetical protein